TGSMRAPKALTVTCGTGLRLATKANREKARGVGIQTRVSRVQVGRPGSLDDSPKALPIPFGKRELGFFLDRLGHRQSPIAGAPGRTVRAPAFLTDAMPAPINAGACIIWPVFWQK